MTTNEPHQPHQVYTNMNLTDDDIRTAHRRGLVAGWVSQAALNRSPGYVQAVADALNAALAPGRLVTLHIVAVDALGCAGVVAEIRDAGTGRIVELSGRKRNVMVDGRPAEMRAKSEALEICRVSGWKVV